MNDKNLLFFYIVYRTSFRSLESEIVILMKTSLLLDLLIVYHGVHCFSLRNVKNQFAMAKYSFKTSTAKYIRKLLMSGT